MSHGNPLLSLLRRCVVRIDADGEFRGSGFFVSPGEVLTCAHVVHGADRVAVSGAGEAEWESPAEVAARVPEIGDDGEAARFHPLPDLALLRVSSAPAEQPCARLDPGVPAAGAEPDALWLSGFCRDAHEPGKVGRSAATAEFESGFEEDGWELLKLKEGQVIGGFSGCPVLNLRTGGVCGLIDSSRSETDDLGGFAVPTSTVGAAFPGLLDRNAELHGADGGWGRAVAGERAAAARRRGDAERLPLLPPMSQLRPDGDYAPSELLKPRFGMVGMIGREDLQAQLMRWRESGRRMGVLLIAGSGGLGKTRLALEECVRAGRAGWAAGLLTLDPSADQDAALDRLVAWEGPLFVAIDYAETRPSLVGSLILRLARRASGPPVRLLLACRQVRTRREVKDLFATGDGRDAIAEVLDSAEPVWLDERAGELDSRRLFEAGLKATAARIGSNVKGIAVPSLKDPHFARPLYVLGAALLVAEDPAVDIDAMDREELMLELIDRHESQYWERWNESLGVSLDPSMQSRAVAAATLLGAETEEEAMSLVGAIPGLEDAPSERRRKIANWLSRLYGDGDPGRAPAIAPMEPDMLAEALVARECAKHPSLLADALDAASDAQLTRVLTVLTRAAGGSERLPADAGKALDERLPGLTERVASVGPGGAELVAALEGAVAALRPSANVLEAARELPAKDPSTAALACSLYRMGVDRLRSVAGESPERQGELAGALNNLSNALDALGRREEALAVVEEATASLRELAERDPGRYVPSLATSLANLSATNRSLGRKEEALAIAEEAVRLREGLVQQSRGEYLGDLAASLNNLSNVLRDLGRDAEALEAGKASLGHFRELAERDPDRYLANLAAALNNLAGTFIGLGQGEEALAAAVESVGRHRELTARNRERYLPDLAMSLNTLASILNRTGHHEKGLEAVEESVGYYRSLAQESRERYLPDLAASLPNLATSLNDMGRAGEAVAVGEEAVEHYRGLAALSPGRYVQELAAALNSLAGTNRGLGRTEEALAAAGESVRLRERLVVQKGQGWYLPDLARSLTNLASALLEAGKSEEARVSIEKAVEHYRGLAQGTPERYMPELATALSTFSNALHSLGRDEEALAVCEEAVGRRRELANGNPELHLADLAMSLNNLANLLDDLGRDEEALAAYQEVVGHYRRLAQRNPEPHLVDLAGTSNNLSRILRKTGHLEEAVQPIEESVGLYRELAERDPERHLSGLAMSLNNLANLLDDLGRAEEGRAAIEESVAKHHDDPASAPLKLALLRWHLANEDDPAPVVRSGRTAIDGAEEAGDLAARAQARVLLRMRRGMDEAGFDVAWEREAEGEPPVWLRHLTRDEDLTDLLIEWVEASTWAESRELLERQAARLLTEEGEATAEAVLDSQPDQPGLAHRVEVLKAVRREGIDATYERIAKGDASTTRRKRLGEWLEKPEDESLQFLLDHTTELIDPASEQELLELALDRPDDLWWFIPIALLALSRGNNPTAAYARLNEERPLLEDAACLRSADDAEVQALARLDAGLHEEDADRQLQHAIAAAAAGQEREAGQAVERCRQLLPSWERAGYLRRLEELAEAHPDFREPLERLKPRLLAEGDGTTGGNGE